MHRFGGLDANMVDSKLETWRMKTAMLLDKYASSFEEGNKQFTMQRRAFEFRICFLLHVALGWISLTGLNLINGNTGRNHESTVLPLRRRLWKF